MVIMGYHCSWVSLPRARLTRCPTQKAAKPLSKHCEIFGSPFNVRLPYRGFVTLRIATARPSQAESSHLIQCATKEEQETRKKWEKSEIYRVEGRIKVDPVGILAGMDPLIAKPLPFIFVKGSYRQFKVLKETIEEEEDGLLEFSTGYENMGLKRHPRHGVEFYEWAPAAKFCSLVGDFNQWTHRANCPGKGYLGRDDYGYWRIFVPDNLREGEEEYDEDDVFEEYNYLNEYDKGDEHHDFDAIFQQMSDDYWEPGEEMNVDLKDLAKNIWDEVEKYKNTTTAKQQGEEVDDTNKWDLESDEDDDEESDIDEEDDDPEAYLERYGEDLDTIQEAYADEGVEDVNIQKSKQRRKDYDELYHIEEGRTRYEKWIASDDYEDYGLPPTAIIDDGTSPSELTSVHDPVWEKRVSEKKAPLRYWELMIRGRKAWEQRYTPGIPHLGRYLVYLHTPDGPLKRVSAWASYVLPDKETGTYCGVFWDPPPEERHKWRNPRPEKPSSLRIYECHVGISSEFPRVSTFNEFTEKVIPHVKEAGYNAIQLIGVQEHEDYNSVGYKVTNMFAISSRFGTPEDFKRLVDTAHGFGLVVFMDIVHSHVAPNEMNGLGKFDGSADCYTFPGKRGTHKRWGTRMLRFEEYEVLRYLLSNLRWWVEEYQIDGFQFHSVNSMIYTHNGFSDFVNGVTDYCNQYVDKDAQLYLMCANEMLHQLNPNIVTIAEDITRYPGLCAPIIQGGMGFDYCVNVLPSEMWAHLAQEIPWEEWSMTQIIKTLTDDTVSIDKVLTYTENHNQSIIGGKSLAELILENPSHKRTKTGKAKLSTSGVQLLQIIKLLTFSAGGSAYLAFMGNEFGHPECVEFPKPANRNSFARARRQWDLLQDDGPHSQLACFDRAVMTLDDKENILKSGLVTVCHVDETAKIGLGYLYHSNPVKLWVITYKRGSLLFTYNFHHKNFYEVYRIGVPDAGDYVRILDTDLMEYGGSNQLAAEPKLLSTSRGRLDGFSHILALTLPPQTAQVYRLERVWDTSK